MARGKSTCRITNKRNSRANGKWLIDKVNMYDPVVQFCVSFITMNVAEVGLNRVIGS